MYVEANLFCLSYFSYFHSLFLIADEENYSAMVERKFLLLLLLLLLFFLDCNVEILL